MHTIGGFSDSIYSQLSLWLSVVVVVAFGVFALWNARKHKVNKMDMAEMNAEFVTARGSTGTVTLMFSFYAGAVGSWVITATPSYAAFAGVIGAVVYAISAAYPLVLIAALGNKLQERYPNVLSLSDFAYKRFGRFTQVLVVLIGLLNLMTACCAEYTTIASLFSDFVGLGTYDIFMVLLIGFVTLTYTTVGGLRTSLVTDKAQGISSLVLFTIVLIYLASTFRIPSDAHVDAETRKTLLGTTPTGYSSIFTMPLSMLTATVFSEAVWQRVWASENPKVLMKSSMWAAVLVFIVVFCIGITGVLAGFADLNVVNENLRLFYVLQPFDAVGDNLVGNWIGVVVIVLTVTMSESAVDSMQNGIGGTVNGAIAGLYPRHSLTISRIVVVILNIPLIFVGTLGLGVINLFLLTNLVATCAAFPIILGIIPWGFFTVHLTDYVPPVSFLLSMASLVGYGYSDVSCTDDQNCVLEAFKMAFYANNYAWQYFLVAVGVSIASTLILCFINSCFACGGGQKGQLRTQAASEF